MKPPVDELNRETVSSAQGRFPIRVKFLSLLSATLCGFVLLVLGAFCLYNLGMVVFFGVSPALSSSPDPLGLTLIVVAVMPLLLIWGFFAFCLGIAFGRFLLRVMPPPLFGLIRRRQIAAIAVSLGVTVISYLILTAVFRTLLFSAASPPEGTATSDVVLLALALAGSAFCTIPWAIGAVGPLLLRHRTSGAFLERPFVLFLRRFSTFSDRTITALVLRQARAGIPVVFLTPTHSRPRDWDPFIVGFAGLKLLHPLRSVPMIIRARDDDWQRAAEELIGRAQTIVVDISEGSAALQTETEMIERGRRWPRTVCLRHALPAARSGQDCSSAVSNARCINYSKSWTRAIPKLAISLPIALLAAYLVVHSIANLAQGLPFSSSQEGRAQVFSILVATLFFHSIFWRPAVSRNAKIELRRVLLVEN